MICGKSFFFPPYFTPSAPPFLYFFLLCSPSLLFSQCFSSFISPPLKPPHGLLSIPFIFRILSAFVNQIFCLLPILIADKNKLNDKEPNETERQIKKVISMLEYQTKRLVKSLWKMEFQCSNLHIQAGRICVWLIWIRFACFSQLYLYYEIRLLRFDVTIYVECLSFVAARAFLFRDDHGKMLCKYLLSIGLDSSWIFFCRHFSLDICSLCFYVLLQLSFRV